ncbi:MAG: diguanylate cyclase [Candidatus Hatepunaea meridiana]|nr:diguanylate cyclase [Candidatus Hatepunaea meridiana]
MSTELTVQQVLDAVNTGLGLKTFAPVMKRVAAAVSGPKPDNKSLKDLIWCDTALAMNLLRAANRQGQYDDPVVDIDGAIERVGTQTLRNLALSTEFIDIVHGDEKATSEYDMLNWMWERSLFNATSAGVIAEKLSAENKDHFHTLGLLLNIGAHFLLNNFTEQYLPVLDRWRTEGGLLSDHEQHAIGIDHTLVGHHLAKTWNLGPIFEQVIRDHHKADIDQSDDPTMKILCLANHASDIFFIASRVGSIEKIIDVVKQNINIDSETLANLLQRISLEADRYSYNVSSGATAISSINLLRIINTELGRATLTYDQMVHELKQAMKKAETLAIRLEDANKKLREAANIDPLTKIYNRRFFEEFLSWNFNRSKRYKTTLGCMMIDIDNFKRFNDTYGHLTGDRILQGVAEVLRNNLRGTDVLSRFGGEEFIILLPETPPSSVCFTAKKLHKAILETSFPVDDKSLSVTVSIGYHCYSGNEGQNIPEPKSLVKYADANMYRAKVNGRNQVWPSNADDLTS